MTFLNQDQILKSIIPDVFISKITLETFGGSNDAEENDPHIDIKKPALIKDPDTGKLKVPNIKSELKKDSFGTDNSIRDGQLINESNNEKLMITVDIILKEKLQNNLIGTWFKNENFSKYLKLKVIQSTKKNLTNLGTTNKNLLFLMDKNDSIPLSEDFKLGGINLLSSQLEVLPSQNIYNILDQEIKTQELNVIANIDNKSNITNKYTEIDNDGNTIVNFNFKAKFILNNSNPEHLAYFAFSYIDLNELIKDFKLTISPNFGLPVGKIVSDVVIDNSQIVSESFVFIKEDGTLWTGSINDTEVGIFGVVDNQTNIPLKKILVGNSKIQDFRRFKHLERLVLNFSFIENNNIFDSKLLQNNKINVEQPDMFFSDLNLSVDENRFCRFFFSINFKKILKQNAIFGKIFDNNELSEQIIKNAKILSLKIFRKRIQGSPEIGSSANINNLFDNNQIDDVIVISGEKFYKNFVEVNNNKASLKEVNDLYFSNININNLNGIRHFTGIDKDIFNITDGYYTYSIELEIEDSSIDFLVDKIQEIRDAKNNLNKYYQEAIKVTSSKVIISNANPHIDFFGENNLEKSEVKIGNFDPNLNRFTNKFINEQKEKYKLQQSIPLKTPWEDAINVYIENIKLFSSNKILFDEFKKTLLYFTHPATGNPSGILKLINLMDNLESNIAKAININPTVLATAFSYTSDSPSKSGILRTKIPTYPKISNKRKIASKSFKIFYTFKNFFNASIPKLHGYDFLNITSSDELNGLRILSENDYNDRIERETNHYFNIKNNKKPDINLSFKDQIYTSNDNIDNTSYSYLTPAKITVSDKIEISRLGHSPTPLLNQEDLAYLDFSIKTYNNTSNKLKSKNIDNKINIGNVKQNILSDALSYFSQLNIEPILIHNNNKINLSDIISNSQILRKPALIDPLIQDNSVCMSPDNKDLSAELNNNNPLPLLIKIAKDLNTFRENSTISPDLRKSSFSLKSSKKINISAFDLENKNNKISEMIQDQTRHSSDAFFQGLPHNTTLDLALSKLPNQVKSLFLSRTNPESIRKNWLQMEEDPIRTTSTETEFRLSYRMINTVQVFNGYQKSKDGDVLLKNPLWEPLTLYNYNQSVGEFLLCRMVPYENKIIGIEKDPSLDLPHYNQYFLIKAKRKASNVELPGVLNNNPILLPPENIVQLNIRTEYMTNNVININDPLNLGKIKI